MKKTVTALLISAALSAPAFAANAGSTYIAADYGGWNMSNAGMLPNPGALTFSAGYYFTPNVGAEVGYAFVGDSTVYYPGGSTVYSQSALKFAAVGTVPVSPQFDVFGKVGIDIISGQLSDTFAGTSSASTTNLMFGFGGLFHLNNNMGVRVQYESLGKTKASAFATGADVSMLSVGFVYSF